MTDNVIELSSDEDICIPNNIPDKNNYDSDTTIDSEISALINKYKQQNENDHHTPPQMETISSSSSDDEISDIQKLKAKYDILSTKIDDLLTANISPTNLKSTNVLNDSDDDDDVPKPKKRKSKIDEEKNQKKQQKEQEKLLKQVERERIKAENAKAKAEKQQLAFAYKNLKPDECIKFITASIDSELISSECGTDIPNCLQTANISFKVASNLLPFTITWSRKIQAQLSLVDGQLGLNKNEENCNEILLIMLWKEFVNLVHENKLTRDFKTKQSLLMNKKIYLGIYGLDNYFRFHKTQKQKISSKDKIYADSPKISRKDIDMALIELQLLFNVSHRFLETSLDVSAMILQFSKSIAQIPYKLQKQMKHQQMDWYVSGDNKDCVRVDKNGNGLHRLWQQQITQFTLARLETAEAITSKYPSPSSLIRAYEECSSVDEGEKLLQDIPIRRAAGPLTSVRKIGPELSKKMYTLFSSTDGNVYL